MRDNKLLKIIGNIIFYIVLILLVYISFVMIKSVKEDRQPTIMGQKFFTVLTGSMEPTIMVGDLVIAKEVLPEDIKVGDIITFSGNDKNNTVTHRVKEVINDDGKVRYITQGDANNAQDQEPVESDLVIGKVVKWIPKVGAIASWMKLNLKLIISLILAITFIGTICGRLISKLNSKDRKEELD